MADKWPEVLTKDQFINALEQFYDWAWDHTDEYPEVGQTREMATAWVDGMDAIDPCWPEDQRNRGPIFAAIIAERVAQDKEWGGHGHDTEHRLEDWLEYIDKQCSKAYTDMYRRNTEEAKQRLVKIAALAIAALEALD